jgi:hypothetical protein
MAGNRSPRKETTIRLAARVLFQFLVERTPAAGGR